MEKQKSASGAVMEIVRKIDKFGGIQRLGCIFDTVQQGYFYDSGTGKVVRLDNIEQKFFRWLYERKPEDGYEEWRRYNQGKVSDEGLISLYEAIEQEHILEAPYPSRMYSVLHQEKLEETLQEDIRMVTLELTGRCNLRCGYCIYNEGFQENRDFSDSDMSEETAKKAIDFLSIHGGDNVAVTFYGGEPLLRYPLIKECIAYAKSVMPDKNLSYSMTSNMTLMTREKAEFFYGIEQFGLVASLDGPEAVHNAYRKYPNGRGSFEDTIRGLKILAEVFGEDFPKRVSISMVFAPPYTYEHLEKINRFFMDLDWMPKETQKLLSYPEKGSVEYTLEESDGVQFEEGEEKGYVNTINKWTQEVCRERDLSSAELPTRKPYEDVLLRIHKRALTKEPSELYGLNGSCVPGARRLYITTDGNFKPCDRIGVCPFIGDVDHGWDFEAIRKLYVEDYIKASGECENCWAKRMCGVCYAKIYAQDKISIEKKKYECDMARHTTKEGLVLYHTLLENDPESLRYLNEMQ